MNRTFLFLLAGILFTGSVVSYISPAFAEISYDTKIETAINDLERFSGNEHLSKPTFGLSHQSGQMVVYDGFILNNQPFAITNNFHTPFAEQPINLGDSNSFAATVYSPKGLKVQEFLFGIPDKGDAQLAELGIEVWYDKNGEIENLKAIQKSNIVDENLIFATHQKTKCMPSDLYEKCDKTKISLKFLEPLKDKVMALKAIDYNNRFHITYLNEGLDISDSSLNPMPTRLIMSPVRDEGLLQITQTAKYSPYWMTEDGRTFMQNNFGSFKRINFSFERFQDSGDPLTRLHSGFGGILKYEKERAVNIFNASSLLSDIPSSISNSISISDRITIETKEKMTEQEKIAQILLEDSQVQARYSKHSRN